MLLSLLMAGTTLAQETEPATTAQPPIEVVAPPAEKKVCRSERSISTRVVKRTCKTPTEWQRDSLDARNRLKLGNANRAAPDAFKSPASQ